MKPDPDVAMIVDERRSEVEKYTSRIVGRTTRLLQYSRDESPVGNLVTDALLDYGGRQGWRSDVAFYNSAGLRADIPAGDVTYGQLYEVLPFSDVVISLDMRGDQLRAVFEKVAGGAGRLAVSGGVFAYHYGGASDHRLISVSVGGQPIDPGRVYHVVATDYLLGGGDGHDEFRAGANIVYGDYEVDAVAAYMTAHSPLDRQIEGRVLSQ